MGKVDHRRLSTAQLKQLESELSTAIRVVARDADIVSFVQELLTQSERVMLARRIRIAKMLLAGNSQDQIIEKLHVGISTAQNVERWLQSFPAYRRILPPLYEEFRKKKRGGWHPDDYAFPPTFRTLRKKYPLHFLLFNLLLDE